MKRTLFILTFALGMGAAIGVQAQQTFTTPQAITCFGGDAASNTASLSYSGGEVAVQYAFERAITVVNVTESFSEGVQQPYTDRDRRTSQGIDPLAVSVQLYPNPTADNVVLESQQFQGQLRYTLFGTAGQVLQQGSYAGGQQVIELTDYAAGSYMLQVATPDGKQMNVYKIIKNK